MKKKKQPSIHIKQSTTDPTIKKQQQAKRRKILMTTGIAFIAAIVAIIVYGVYESEIKPRSQTVIQVNDTTYEMNYYVDMLDAYSKNYQPEFISNLADPVANQIVRAELINQGSRLLNITVSQNEIDEVLKETEFIGETVYEDIARTDLLETKILEYFRDRLPDSTEQINAKIMLVESASVAELVKAEIESEDNFDNLVADYSRGLNESSDLGWMPEELIDGPVISELIGNMKPGMVDSVYDESATKQVGYWIIEGYDHDEVEGRKVRVMLLPDREIADEIYLRLESEAFEELAGEYSLHGTAATGGDLDWIQVGDMANDIFDEVAFNIELNEISEPVMDTSVQTPGGYWIVQLLAREEHELEEDTRSMMAETDYTDWLVEQQQNSTIEINLDGEAKAWAIRKVSKRR